MARAAKTSCFASSPWLFPKAGRRTDDSSSLRKSIPEPVQICSGSRSSRIQNLLWWQTPATEDQGQFSPDGHWIAYTSNETGQSEIYVIPFPLSTSGGKWMVSRGGGVQPRWRRNGKELFYISPDSKMMVVAVDTRPVFHIGTPRALFQTDIVDTGIRTGPMSWDIAPDGNRFIIITESPGEASSITVALNWRDTQTK